MGVYLYGVDELLKEPLIKCTIGRIAALCPRSPLAYLYDMSRVLGFGFLHRSTSCIHAVVTAGRLALHAVITLNQRFLSVITFYLLAKNSG